MGRRQSAMVVYKGILTCWPTFSWTVLCIGCFLTSTINGDPAVVHKHSHKVKSTPGVVRSQEKSLEDCAQACAEETRIKCDFFKYRKDTETCLMSGDDHNQRRPHPASKSHVTTIAKRKGLKQRKTAGGRGTPQQTKDLDEQLRDERNQALDMEKLKSTVTDLHDQIQLLQRGRVADSHRARASKEAQELAFSQFNRRLMGMKVDGEKFKAAVHALSNMQQLLAREVGGMKQGQQDVLLKVSELEKTEGGINNLVSSLKATDRALENEMDALKDGTNHLAIAFSKLRSRINEELANKEMPPGVIKLKHNQGTLATALENVLDKVSSLNGRLPYLETELRNTNQKVVNQAMYEREVQAKLKMFYKSLIEVKKAVHTLLDPNSPLNMERNKGVVKVKADVSMLAEMNKGLKNDVLDQREDLARLIKDVARVQILAQNLRQKLGLVLTASRQFQQDMARVKQNQKNTLSVVEVAEMQKQVLTAVSRLKIREAILLKHLKLYRTAVKKLATKVEKSDGSRGHTKDVVSQMHSRLNRFEKEIQLLFRQTGSLMQKLQKPQTPKGINNLIRSQSETNNKVANILKQLQTLRKRLSLLSIDLQETKIEAVEDKNAMEQDMKEREKEMRQREQELKKQAIQDKQETKMAVKIRKKQLEKEKLIEKRKLEQQVKLEQRKRKLEEEKNRMLRKEQLKKLPTKTTEKKLKVDRITHQHKQTTNKHGNQLGLQSEVEHLLTESDTGTKLLKKGRGNIGSQTTKKIHGIADLLSKLGKKGHIKVKKKPHRVKVEKPHRVKVKKPHRVKVKKPHRAKVKKPHRAIVKRKKIHAVKKKGGKTKLSGKGMAVVKPKDRGLQKKKHKLKLVGV